MRSMTQRAIVTGAGSARGIGLATAAWLVRGGWSVALTDIDEVGLRANAERLAALGAERVPVAAADIRSEAEVGGAIGELVSELGGVEALVNVAGVTAPTRFL